MQFPTIRSYGKYASSKYSANCLSIEFENLRLYFSYDTVIAFSDGRFAMYYGGDFHIRKNDWSTITGKHLNWINPDQSIREDSETFEKNLEKALRKHNLVD